ncbi:hypothetical protein KP78_15770 [Jeotgalibacillus soli]|uniref:Uncharacterized protein n=1 Tax=Jeotgalibacillus soli TaxID=889306 RepID=A0A0C2S3G8_9BACL|nr:hypothetical protein KP78_15770 [Jeotgalibacillus soli]
MLHKQHKRYYNLHLMKTNIIKYLLVTFIQIQLQEEFCKS